MEQRLGISADMTNNWKYLVESLSPLIQDPTILFSKDLLLQQLATVTADLTMKHRLHVWVVDEMKRCCFGRLANEFWRHLDIKDSHVVECLSSAIHFLHCELFSRKDLIDVVGRYAPSYCRDLWEEILLAMQTVVFINTSHSIDDVAQGYLKEWFRAFCSCSASSAADVSNDNGCGAVSTSGADRTWVETCQHCTELLYDLQLTQLLVRSLNQVINAEIKHILERMCSGRFNSHQLKDVLHWVDSQLFTWIKTVLYKTTVDSLSIWKDRLQLLICHLFGSLRISEMFDIIIDFPDSVPAIADLKECIEQTGQKQQLICSLKESFELRLLHPGANTPDILTQYVSAIRALRLLDPTGVVLEQSCQPVKQYLKQRGDTVRCIVANLTDNSNNELSDELMQSDPVLIEGSDDSDYDDAENWLPDPVDADPEKMSKSRKSSDIISLLVNIYGSKDLFIAEYQSLLADRLLTSLSYDIDKETRNLELLKLRFGDSSLQYCEVMLKDVGDSRRTNSLIHEQTTLETEVNAMVLSDVFWPTLKDEKFKLPEPISSVLNKYTEGFTSLKANRTLEWKEKLGVVELSLDLADRVIELSVTPARATVIMAFQGQSTWTVDALSRETQMTQSLLGKRLAFWVSHGILHECAKDTFTVVEEQRCDMIHLEHRYDDLEGENNEEVVEDQRQEKLQVCWSFIVGMLTNLGSLSLERIHSMLKMFAVQGPSVSGGDCSVQELKAFLDTKVRQEELTLSGSVYRLAKTH